MRSSPITPVLARPGGAGFCPPDVLGALTLRVQEVMMDESASDGHSTGRKAQPANATPSPRHPPACDGQPDDRTGPPSPVGRAIILQELSPHVLTGVDARDD